MAGSKTCVVTLMILRPPELRSWALAVSVNTSGVGYLRLSDEGETPCPGLGAQAVEVVTVTAVTVPVSAVNPGG